MKRMPSCSLAGKEPQRAAVMLLASRNFASHGDQRECFGAAGWGGGNQAWEVVRMEAA